mgnify:CR=1 FL=1
MRLKDKVTLITGGARGIGREIALTFAREGSHIALCDVNAETLAATEKGIGSLGVQVLTSVVDVTKLAQADEFTQKTLDKFGFCCIL